MIWRIYNLFYRTLLTFIVLFVLLLTLNHAVFIFVKEYLQQNSISYSKIEGTLFNGIAIHNVKYKEILSAKSIEVYYDFMPLLALKPLVKTVQTRNLEIDIDKIQTDENKSNASVNIIPFKIANINLHNTLIIFKKQHYNFDIKLQQLAYKKVFNIKTVKGNFNTPYAFGTIEAKVVNSRLLGRFVKLVPSDYTNKKYLNFLVKTPDLFDTEIEADNNEIILRTNIDLLLFKDVKDIAVYNQKIDFEYFLSKQDFNISSSYDVEYKKSLLNVKQSTYFTMQGDYNSQLHVNLAKQQKAFIKTLDASVFGNANKIVIDANASDYKLHVKSDDYNKYNISLSNNNINILQGDTISFLSNATATMKPLHVKGGFTLLDKFTQMQGVFTYKEDILRSEGTINVIKENELYKKYHLTDISPLQFAYKREKNEDLLKLKSKILNLLITHHDSLIKGTGNFASAVLKIKSNLSEEKPALDISTEIPSLSKFLNETKLTSKNDSIQYDGILDANTTLNFDDEIAVNSSIFSPWISVRTNSQTKHVLKNIKVHAKYKNMKIFIKNYKAEYKKFKFYTKQTSEISLDNNSTISIDKFYIYDNLILRGNIDPSHGNMKLHVYGDKFNIVTDEMNVSAKADINIDVQNSVSQVVDGNITLLKGVISYAPPPDYSVSDEDIIIVQDQKLQDVSNLAMNIHVNALNSIKYKTKQADIDFIPAITIYKESRLPVKYIGQVSIDKGKIFAQEKEFYFIKADDNKIMFNTQELNPQLNLLLHYKTLDYKEIFIRITNTLASPVIIFSSNPPMSENDIMSYILFGEAANSVFDSSGASKTSLNYLLVGSGLKNIFKQGTGIKIDTLNILNNTDGTYGYEVGAKLNKNIRVVYKNDISSSVVVQYGLGQSTRIDVDVHNAGQGIYLIYIKDIK